MKLKHFIEKLQKLDPEMEVVDDLWTEEDFYRIAEEYDSSVLKNLSRSDAIEAIRHIEVNLDACQTMYDQFVGYIDMCNLGFTK